MAISRSSLCVGILFTWAFLGVTSSLESSGRLFAALSFLHLTLIPPLLCIPQLYSCWTSIMFSLCCFSFLLPASVSNTHNSYHLFVHNIIKHWLNFPSILSTMRGAVNAKWTGMVPALEDFMVMEEHSHTNSEKKECSPSVLDVWPTVSQPRFPATLGLWQSDLMGQRAGRGVGQLRWWWGGNEDCWLVRELFQEPENPTLQVT